MHDRKLHKNTLRTTRYVFALYLSPSHPPSLSFTSLLVGCKRAWRIHVWMRALVCVSLSAASTRIPSEFNLPVQFSSTFGKQMNAAFYRDALLNIYIFLFVGFSHSLKKTKNCDLFPFSFFSTAQTKWWVLFLWTFDKQITITWRKINAREKEDWMKIVNVSRNCSERSRAAAPAFSFSLEFYRAYTNAAEKTQIGE